MAKYQYDASRIYRLNGVSERGSTVLNSDTMDPLYKDLTDHEQ